MSSATQTVVHWIRNDVLGFMNRYGIPATAFDSDDMAELWGLQDDGTISSTTAKAVLRLGLQGHALVYWAAELCLGHMTWEQVRVLADQFDWETA